MPETGSVHTGSFLEDTDIGSRAVARTCCLESECWTESHFPSPRSDRCMLRMWLAGLMLDSKGMEQRTVERLMELV